ncbi:MAG: SprA-related family protein [Candidatus Riflebacteria bacterium]|nr:SprA-related family protein [Candidatus Riflebacteria bacterium]
MAEIGTTYSNLPSLFGVPKNETILPFKVPGSSQDNSSNPVSSVDNSSPSPANSPTTPSSQGSSSPPSKPFFGSKQSNPSDSKENSEIQQLKKTDQNVRDHEAAHVAAGGTYVKGGATFQFKTGPDGKQYAVAGEVDIDTSPVANDPEATIRKMESVKRAALAPADPSSQDQSVAVQASEEATKAQFDLIQLQSQKNSSKNIQTNAVQSYNNIQTATSGSLGSRINQFA